MRSSIGLTPSDEAFTLDIPEPSVDTKDERKTARISKTKQWKQAVEYIEGRQEAYRQYIPGVNPAITKSDDNWKTADCVIRELQQFKEFIEVIANGVSG